METAELLKVAGAAVIAATGSGYGASEYQNSQHEIELVELMVAERKEMREFLIVACKQWRDPKELDAFLERK